MFATEFLVCKCVNAPTAEAHISTEWHRDSLVFKNFLTLYSGL